MAFNAKITELLDEDIGRNADQEIQTLRDANRILRKYMFTGNHQFDGSLQNPTVQSTSVPDTLMKFFSHLMGGCGEEIHQSIKSIAQLVLFNTVKKRRKGATGNPRHQRSRETPVPVYVGLLVHDRVSCIHWLRHSFFNEIHREENSLAALECIRRCNSGFRRS